MMKSPNIDGILQVRFLNYINNKIDLLNGRTKVKIKYMLTKKGVFFM